MSRLVWTLRRTQRHRKPHRLSIAVYAKMNLCPWSHGKDPLLECARVLERSSVDCGDYIACTDFRARHGAARVWLLKNRAMGYGHAETGSDRPVHRPDLRADPPT
jgi:hypothetical protein